MKLNQAGLDLIKNYEGWRSKAYPDPATGGEPITIGYGHTSAAGTPKVTLGMKITPAEGEAILLKDLQGTIGQVTKLVKVPLNDNQFSALVSFAFNVGAGNLQSSTLLRLVNAGEFGKAASEFQRWNRGAGKVMAGLTARRAAEQRLFLTTPLTKPS